MKALLNCLYPSLSGVFPGNSEQVFLLDRTLLFILHLVSLDHDLKTAQHKHFIQLGRLFGLATRQIYIAFSLLLFLLQCITTFIEVILAHDETRQRLRLSLTLLSAVVKRPDMLILFVGGALNLITIVAQLVAA